MRAPLLLLPLLALLAPGAAGACTMTPNPHRFTPAEAQAAARRLVDSATAIIDGEVIQPFVPGQAAAMVRVHRRFKGPEQAEYRVGVLTTCDTPLMRLGERQRMILTGGPDIWFLRMRVTDDGEVDRVLGSDRRVDWPYVQGTWAGPTP
jgi:hypothetical protein